MEAPRSNPPDLSIIVEQQDGNRYKVQSSQLEQIGAQLRGKQQFSIFYSIILPIIVSVATVIVSSLFQYVSWINTVRVQNATEAAAKASAIYQQAAQAIGKRYYAEFVFLPAVRNLAGRKADVDSHLYNFDLELNKKRFDSYFDQVRSWNENYDQLITEIDYSLDRPIFLQAGIGSEGNAITINKIKNIDCTQSLPEQVQKVGFNKNSLKAQFATINHCFADSIADFLSQKDKAIMDTAATIDPAVEDKANDRLGHLESMANEFRCYALLRIDYYINQKETAIVSLRSLFQKLYNLRAQNAEAHFRNEIRRCVFITSS